MLLGTIYPSISLFLYTGNNMPPKSKRPRRGNAWTDDETKCMLSIWGDMHIQSQLDSPSKADTAVYSKVCKAMLEMGFEKKSVQCKERMKTLKKSYRQGRDTLKKSGQPRKLCKFFDQLNEILDTRPATSPGKVVQSLQQSVASDTDISDHEVEDNHGSDNNLDDVELADRGDDNYVENNQNEQPNEQLNEQTNIEGTKDETHQKKQKGKQRKTKLQTTMETVMDKFTKSNEEIEARQIDLEKKRIELEMRKIEDEKEKREFELRKLDKEERQKASDREHQLRMLQLIMNSRQPYAIPPSINGPQPQVHPAHHAFLETVPGTSSGDTSPVSSHCTNNNVPHRGQRRTSGSITHNENGKTYYNM